jgi:hypothetical protein
MTELKTITEDRWIFYPGIDFNNEAFIHYHIDTRDFHCIANEKRSEKAVNRERIKQLTGNYFFTQQEVIDLIDRYFKESGEVRKWRLLMLSGEGKKYTVGWELKYLRIQRTKRGFLICNSRFKPLSKEILNNPVQKDEYS